MLLAVIKFLITLKKKQRKLNNEFAYFFILFYIPIFLSYFIILLGVDIFILEKTHVNYRQLLERSFDFSIYIYILWCFLKCLSVIGKNEK